MLPIHFPTDLPVAERREDIAAAIREHQVVIVAGETGSGKTTQLPKICLQMGRGSERLIGHTQPRRLAARTVAQRIASELDSELGGLVGFQVRFSDQVSSTTAIKLMTDGILLAEIQRDRLLKKYDTLIIDEAHERSLNIDFLLGYLKRILPRRPDLKLIITSATIDLESFSRHFADAPVIQVSGRTFPVTTVYQGDVEADEDNDAQIVGLIHDIEAGRLGPRGDCLVFLPGEREIRQLARQLRGQDNIEVLPLYARLSQREQQRVFSGSSGKNVRAVLATNVAETSLTVPGIRYVIDTGMARLSRYSYRTKVQRLPIEPISQASANQRQGRCGRVAAGTCFRLYSEQDFESRPAYTDPEILRTSLAAVVLQMLNLGLGEVSQFPFINPPDPRLVRDGYKLLEELDAVTAAGKMTAIGRRMAQLPVDPRLARMVLAGNEEGCLEEVLIISSALAIQDPRERPSEKQAQADQFHARFRHPRSDFMAWLNLWRYYEEQRQALSQNQLRKLSKREYLSFMRMREWRDVHAQLSIAARQQRMKLHTTSLPAPATEENYRGIHRALLAGLLGNIAQHHEGREYLGVRNRKLQIFPGSHQQRQRPKWLVAAEIVETGSTWARVVGAIDPQWIVDIHPTLLKRHYYEPRWQSASGRVLATERLSLYGLTIADKRPVHYGPIAPQEARQLFIREGLVAGHYRRFPPFLKYNQRLLRELQELESRTRRRDIVAEEQLQFEFYDQHLPDDIYTTRRLEAWLKQTAGADERLRMDRDLLLAFDPGSGVGQQFPDQLLWEDMQFTLSYLFEPGTAADGVSVTIPVALLNRVPQHLFDWLVPGLLREKCVQLVRGLPKQIRKQLVPVPDYVARALSEMTSGNTELTAALAMRLSALTGLKLQPSDWDVAGLDDYYRMNIRVVGANGELLEQGRDLAQLVERFRENTRQSISAEQKDSPARQGIKRWDFEQLPKEWRFQQAGIDIVAYPALVDGGDSVAIELADYPEQAYLGHRLGVLQLLRQHSGQAVKYLRKNLLRGNDFALVVAASGIDRQALIEDLIDASLIQVCGLEGALPYSRAEFMTALEGGRGEILTRANELEICVLNILQPLALLRAQLSAQSEGRWPGTKEDIEAQLGRLLVPAFLRDSPLSSLQQYPRYMKALGQRVERLSGQYPKDQKYTELMQGLAEPLWQLHTRRPGLLLVCDDAAQYRWMLEELRVSLFAQYLGTRQSVSQKRLHEQWQRVEAWLNANPH